MGGGEEAGVVQVEPRMLELPGLAGLGELVKVRLNRKTLAHLVRRGSAVFSLGHGCEKEALASA